MPAAPSYSIKRTIIGQLPYGADLYESLTQLVKKEGITCGRIAGLGATTHAVVAFYDQKTHVYNPLEFPGGMEILNLHGNISVRDGQPFVHVHIVLGDAAGRVFGGHLLPGTRLFACEVFVDEFDGPPLTRNQEPRTGLHLWNGTLPGT
ncbi:MAG TPA: PPC domain-containing DNA-binding protein [Bacteroidota bacterium]|nr:PPC domain-containing DNA-binding protein [Bacteroidota bacterium]